MIIYFKDEHNLADIVHIFWKQDEDYHYHTIFECANGNMVKSPAVTKERAQQFVDYVALNLVKDRTFYLSFVSLLAKLDEAAKKDARNDS